MKEYSYKAAIPPLLKTILDSSEMTTIQMEEFFLKNVETIFYINGYIKEVTSEKLFLELYYQFEEDNPSASYSMSGGSPSGYYLSIIFNFDPPFKEKLLNFQKGTYVTCKGKGIKNEGNLFALILTEIEAKILPVQNYKPDNGSCFIATSCYGDYDAPEVLILREFRDNVLSQTYFGKLFVSLYYSVSPSFAAQITKSNWLKKIVKGYFIAPIVRRIRRNKDANQANHIGKKIYTGTFVEKP